MLRITPVLLLLSTCCILYTHGQQGRQQGQGGRPPILTTTPAVTHHPGGDSDYDDENQGGRYDDGGHGGQQPPRNPGQGQPGYQPGQGNQGGFPPGQGGQGNYNGGAGGRNNSTQGGGSTVLGGGGAGGSARGGIDDQCTQDSQCSITNSFCKDGRYCACKEDHVANKDKKKCLPIIRQVGAGRCEDSLQCTEGLGLGSECMASSCACLANYHFSQLDDKPSCYKTKKIGEYCTDVNECTIKPDKEHVMCEGSCKCNMGFTESPDKQQCNGGAMLGGILTLVIVSLLAKFIQ